MKPETALNLAIFGVVAFAAYKLYGMFQAGIGDPINGFFDDWGSQKRAEAETAAYVAGTALIKDKLDIARSKGWIDAQGNFTPEGFAAVANGDYKKAIPQ